MKIDSLMGGSVHEFATNGKNVYATVELLGLMKSDDEGASWKLIYNKNTSHISIDGANIALGSNYNISFSNDSGKSFKDYTLPFGGTISSNIETLHDKIIIARHDSVLISSDSGLSWISTFGATFLTSLKKVGDKLLLTSGYNHNHLYCSYDYGITWTQISTHGIYEASRFANKGDTLLEYNHYGFLLSKNMGVTWLPRTYPIAKGWDDYFLYLSGDTLFYGLRDTVYISMDLGLSWAPVANSPLSFVNNMVKINSTILIGSQKNAVMKMDLNSGKIEMSSKGINGVNIFAFHAHKDSLFVLSNPYLFYYSYDGGIHWTKVKNDYTRSRSLIEDDSSNLYIYNDNAIYKSADGGNTFSFFQKINHTYEIYKMIYKNGNIYCAARSGVYIVPLNGTPNYELGNLFRSIDIAIYDTLIYSIYSSQLVYTSLNNINWIDISDSVKGTQLGSVFASLTNVYYSNLHHSIWKMVPASTIQTYAGPIQKLGRYITFNNNNDEFVFCNVGFKFKRNLPLAHWVIMNDGFTSVPYSASIFCDDTTLFVYSSASGIWRRQYSNIVMTGITEIDSQNLNFEIFPNPNNEILTIKIPPTFRHQLSISIIDTQGRICYTKNISDAGDEALLNTYYLSNGIYFVKISNYNNSAIKRLVVQH